MYSADVESTAAPLCTHVTLRSAVPLSPHRAEHDPQGPTTKLYCPHGAVLQDSAVINRCGCHDFIIRSGQTIEHAAKVDLPPMHNSTE